MSEDKENEITFKMKVKYEGEEPTPTEIKKLVENALFEIHSGLYRVTDIISDKEVDELMKEYEEEDEESV